MGMGMGMEEGRRDWEEKDGREIKSGVQNKYINNFNPKKKVFVDVNSNIIKHSC